MEGRDEKAGVRRKGQQECHGRSASASAGIPHGGGLRYSVTKPCRYATVRTFVHALHGAGGCSDTERCAMTLCSAQHTIIGHGQVVFPRSQALDQKEMA